MVRSGIKSIRDLLNQWDWGLFLLIFLYMALPLFYRSYSIYLIGNAIPDVNALATVAQYQFVDLVLEVIQETFVLAIFLFRRQGLTGPGTGVSGPDFSNHYPGGLGGAGGGAIFAVL